METNIFAKRDKSPFFRLDAALTILSEFNIPRTKTSWGYLSFKMMQDDIVNGFNEFIQIIEKLERDGYVNIEVDERPSDNRMGTIINGVYTPTLIKYKYYKITFEGDFFIKSGGYTQQEKDKKLKRISLQILNISLGIGSGAAALYYIGKIVFWIYQHSIYCGCV